MSVPKPTADEIVAILGRTSLPTLLVEGSTDASVYRCIETLMPFPGIDVLQCGGRETLLEVYIRRMEYKSTVCAFLADQDMWIFGGAPREYDNIIWTWGYSIENDLCSGSDIERLLEPEEKREHRNALRLVCRRFAFEVEEYRAGRTFEVRHHINEVVPCGAQQIDPGFADRRKYRDPRPETLDQILTNYERNLRGKQLFQLLSRHLFGVG